MFSCIDFRYVTLFYQKISEWQKISINQLKFFDHRNHPGNSSSSNTDSMIICSILQVSKIFI